MRITDIIWKERFVEKFSSKHRVAVAEAEEVLRSRPVVRRMTKGRVHGEDVYAALAQIRGGRYLIVFFIRKKHGMILPISARDMDGSERRYYAKHR
ncbi:MAG: BrnT family toxin [Candidatus Tectomicrobia bacterium]|uniref:BrnT family toxin n=1 Tax=Tectimicrobiota bacterium TaxID=2528274 RepID=A0A932M0R0_UNCTE|nr:BrnT family toxin [Candidatus Tectomicrobia bacterium]